MTYAVIMPNWEKRKQGGYPVPCRRPLLLPLETRPGDLPILDGDHTSLLEFNGQKQQVKGQGQSPGQPASSAIKAADA